MPTHLEGKHIFVTGGARGIGRAIAGAFGRERAVVSISAATSGSGAGRRFSS